MLTYALTVAVMVTSPIDVHTDRLTIETGLTLRECVADMFAQDQTHSLLPTGIEVWVSAECAAEESGS